ncbi:MAG: flagellar hook-length control protein FliK [Pseudomonadota bacterium]
MIPTKPTPLETVATPKQSSGRATAGDVEAGADFKAALNDVAGDADIDAKRAVSADRELIGEDGEKDQPSARDVPEETGPNERDSKPKANTGSLDVVATNRAAVGLPTSVSGINMAEVLQNARNKLSASKAGDPTDAKRAQGISGDAQPAVDTVKTQSAPAAEGGLQKQNGRGANASQSAAAAASVGDDGATVPSEPIAATAAKAVAKVSDGQPSAPTRVSVTDQRTYFPPTASGVAEPGRAEKLDLQPRQRVDTSAAEGESRMTNARTEAGTASAESTNGPSAPAAPAKQVAVRLEQVLAETRAQTPESTMLNRSLATGTGQGLVRTIRVELTPASLGQVEVALSMREAELHVQVLTSTADAQQALERDRNLLTQLLKSAGYSSAEIDIDRIAVRQASEFGERVAGTTQASQGEPAQGSNSGSNTGTNAGGQTNTPRRDGTGHEHAAPADNEGAEHEERDVRQPLIGVSRTL